MLSYLLPLSATTDNSGQGNPLLFFLWVFPCSWENTLSSHWPFCYCNDALIPDPHRTSWNPQETPKWTDAVSYPNYTYPPSLPPNDPDRHSSPSSLTPHSISFLGTAHPAIQCSYLSISRCISCGCAIDYRPRLRNRSLCVFRCWSRWLRLICRLWISRTPISFIAGRGGCLGRCIRLLKISRRICCRCWRTAPRRSLNWSCDSIPSQWA